MCVYSMSTYLTIKTTGILYVHVYVHMYFMCAVATNIDFNCVFVERQFEVRYVLYAGSIAIILCYSSLFIFMM